MWQRQHGRHSDVDSTDELYGLVDKFHSTLWADCMADSSSTVLCRVYRPAADRVIKRSVVAVVSRHQWLHDLHRPASASASNLFIHSFVDRLCSAHCSMTAGYSCQLSPLQEFVICPLLPVGLLMTHRIAGGPGRPCLMSSMHCLAAACSSETIMTAVFITLIFDAMPVFSNVIPPPAQTGRRRRSFN